MYNYHNLRSVHLEISEMCNASCPMCPRNISGNEENPYIKNCQLSLADIQNIFKPKFVSQLSSLFMCGNFGDPITANDTLAAFSYFRSTNESMNLGMHTNGSARNTQWWRDLAKTLGKNHYVAFGIDGLEDTNHIYRRNTNWNKIMNNVSAFIDAGGKARWDFLVFAHNEHQVEAAKLLAKKLGFETFFIKKTKRFNNLTSRHLNTDVQLQPPTNEQYQNKIVNQCNTLLENNKHQTSENNLWQILSNSPINCKVAKAKSVYVSAEGYVLPCCWTAAEMYTHRKPFRTTKIWSYIDQVGLETLNAKNYDMEKIINGRFFQEIIPQSWNVCTSTTNKRLDVCEATCADKFDAFTAQFAREDLT